MTLNLQELPDGNGEAPDGKTEDDNRDAGAHPSKEGALIREMVASAIGILAGYHPMVIGRWLRHTSSGNSQKNRRARLLGRTVSESYPTAFSSTAQTPAMFFSNSSGISAPLEIVGAVVGEPDLAIRIFPCQRL